MTSDPDTESMLNTWQWEQGLLLFLSLLPKAGIGNLLVTHPLPRVSGPPHTWEVNLRKDPLFREKAKCSLSSMQSQLESKFLHVYIYISAKNQECSIHTEKKNEEDIFFLY